jgi:hypothetical protein
MGNNVPFVVVLQPKNLVDPIEVDVVSVRNDTLNQEYAVPKAI